MSKEKLIRFRVTLPAGVKVSTRTVDRRPSVLGFSDPFGAWRDTILNHSCESTGPIELTLELEPSALPALILALAILIKEVTE